MSDEAISKNWDFAGLLISTATALFLPLRRKQHLSFTSQKQWGSECRFTDSCSPTRPCYNWCAFVCIVTSTYCAMRRYAFIALNRPLQLLFQTTPNTRHNPFSLDLINCCYASCSFCSQHTTSCRHRVSSLMKMAVFWDITTRSLVHTYRPTTYEPSPWWWRQ
jgi:hypothetical protein